MVTLFFPPLNIENDAGLDAHACMVGLFWLFQFNSRGSGMNHPAFSLPIAVY